MEEIMKKTKDLESVCADGSIPNFEALRKTLIPEANLKDVLLENQLLRKKQYEDYGLD